MPTPEGELSSLLQQGQALTAAGKHADAALVYRAAVRLDPRRAETHLALGVALDEIGELDAACAAFRIALQLQPGFAAAHYALCAALLRLGRSAETVVENRRAVELDPGMIGFHTCLVFYLHYLNDAAAIHAEQRRWVERHAAPFLARPAMHSKPPDPDRPLRIGYVSNDFRLHAAAFVCLPLFEHHDPAQFQIHAYSSTRKPDEVTERFRRRAVVWRDSAEWDGEQLARTIREDRVDILVDLEMHMGGSRLLVFARKPAPVQVAWAFPGGTGLPTIDYRVSDWHLDPRTEDDAAYAETTVRLPDCFWCYDPMTTEPAVNALPALTAGHVTFGCFNNFTKANDTTLALWARVLQAVKGSRMKLIAPAGSGQARVLATFARAGVTKDRVEFVPRRKRERYLELYLEIDVALDPFPYGGHVTMCDGLWMGVPAVTLCGATPVSRVGLSQLTSVGLPHLAARSEDEYVRIAQEIAADIPALAGLRARLRPQMEASPLMDGARFAANMEASYRDMWRRWCAKA